LSGDVRQYIRGQRDCIVRRELERLGYVLDYWLVYRLDFRVTLRATASPRNQLLRAASRGSSRRLHAERMARMTAGVSR
jgi:hypothetical protein